MNKAEILRYVKGLSKTNQSLCLDILQGMFEMDIESACLILKLIKK